MRPTHQFYLAVFLLSCALITFVPTVLSSNDITLVPSEPPPPPFVVTSADKILYGAASVIYTINPDGTGRTALAGGYYPSWSPDGTKIAYTTESSLTLIDHLWVMNADGTNKRQLNFNGQDTGNLALSWSPDSQRIVFQVMDGPGMPSMEIYIVNVDGTGLTRLTNDNFEDIHPQWSPDGTKIAFLSRRGDTNHDVYTMNTDGSNIQRLTFFGAPGASNGTGPPRWSPDGTRIAFQRGLTRNVQGVNTSFGQLMVMDASGGGQTVLHEVKNASFDFPFWSHDGSRISASVGGELYTVSAGGGASFVAYNNTHVPHSWSPDDSRVVYADKGSLYVSSDEDPGTRTKIDTGIFNAMDQFGAPTWKPRAPCNCPTISSPGLQFVQSHWPDSRTNWAMIAEVTAQDGLVLKDVMLGERYLAKKITVPYYNLQTSAYSGRGELKPDSIEGDGTRRTRLVEYNVFEHSEKLVVEAVYAIDKIPAASTSCLFVTQRYEFFRQGVGGRCEPSGTLNCSRFQPKVSYRFFGQSGESLVSLNIPQLRHFQIDQNAKNSAGLFKDCEFDPLPCVPLPADSLPGTFGFERKENPLWDEWYGDVVTNGKSLGVWDNIHTTQFDRVSEPVFCLTCVPDTVFVGAGCPECMHSHWRWSASASDFEQFNHGNLINWPPGSNQDFSFAVVKYRDIEEHPTDFTTLANSERIRTSNTIYTPNLHRYEFSHPDEIAVWYSSTGHRSHDIFYGFGLFFSGAQQSVQINGPMEPQELGLDRRVVYANSELVVDELTSVVVGNLYAEGETTLTPFNPNVVGPLPAGYVVLNNLVINVETEAETSGPNLITFTVPSATDPAVFDSLRIFHAETDPFAPNQTIWVDRTVLAPDSPAPDFISKTITARTRVLGGFAVAALGTPQPTPGNAGIAITAGHTPSQIVAGNDATYTFTVTNAGPDSANGVRLEAQLPPNSVVHTVTPSQGICSFEEGPVRCKLDTLANSGSANVIVVARMRQGGLTLPPTGKTINAIAMVRADETDSDLNNNEVIESAVLLPDTNAAPVVKIVPLATSLFSSPANITLVANATDSDGTITAVEFFDKGVSIGLGSPTGGNDYSLTWNPAPIGTHSIIAIATDNAGRKSITDFLPFRVNGPATITITSPGSGTEFSTTSTIPLTANATYAGGSISQVAFYANGTPLGNGTMGSPNQYNFNWTGLVSGRYSIVGIATDNNGLETASNPVFVNIRINSAPTTNILSPANGSAFATPGNVVITASVVDTDGAITSVKFFDGAIQIGTGSSIGSNQYRMTWSNPSTGAHSITAVAVDDSSASVTSSPITITVSAPPSASITSPTVGAQFTAPATVSLIANASDSDGTIARTDFYANGMFIGSGTSSGPNQYSFNWTDIGIGNYNLTAVAVDNSGLATTSSSVSISVSTPVLFVANSTTLNTAENVIKGRLEALNHTVVVKTAAAAVTADADGKALVVISSTVTPSQVGTKFRTIAVPVLTWESGIYNNMGMTGSGNSDFGTKNNQSQVSITNPTHVLAAGFTGNTSVATSGTFNWGKPNGNAISIGTVVNDTAKTLIFAYPTGTLMPGLTAPARRVGLFMHDNTTLNANGIALLDAAIKWAIGGGTINGSVVIPSPSSANLTTEGLIDWAHWGRGGASVFEHKTGITQQISNFTKIGTAPLSWFNDGPTNFSWTDGTPVLSISDSPTGSNTSGAVGNGYEITVPADTNLKTLKVYVGLWFTQAKMEATLSDDSAVAYVDSSITNNGGVRFGVYTIQYKAGWPGQTLKLRYTILNQFFDPFGNVALSAVTLR